MSVLMIFLDGVGIGSRDPSINPIHSGSSPLFASLLDCIHQQHGSGNGRTTTLSIDANLGIEGLPQSGTGQTALFTGENASKMLGRHFGPYPHSQIRPIVEQKNILKTLLARGKTVHFANAFPQRFFDHIARRKAHMTVTTLSAMTSDVPLLREHDLREGRALSADVTNAGWHNLGYPDMPVIASQEAGRRLAGLAAEFDFVLFEYWKTDHAGHSMDPSEAVEVLRVFDGLLEGVLDGMTDDTLLLITSDHGNIEDITIKIHTRNPVPLVLHGHGHESVAREVLGNQSPNLTCVTPTILQFLTSGQ